MPVSAVSKPNSRPKFLLRSPLLSDMEALTVSVISWYGAIVCCYMNSSIASTGNGEFLKTNLRQLYTQPSLA